MEATTILLPDGPCWSVSHADLPSMKRFLDEFNRRIDMDAPEGHVRLRACLDSLVSRLGVEECEAALARFKAGEQAPAPAAGGGNIAHQSSTASSSTSSSSSVSARTGPGSAGGGASSSNSSQAPTEEAAAAGAPGASQTPPVAASPGKKQRHVGVAVATASADFAGAGVDALSFPSVGQPPPQQLLATQAVFHLQQQQQQWSPTPDGGATFSDSNSGGGGSKPGYAGLSPASITWTNRPLQHQPSPPSGEGAGGGGGGGGGSSGGLTLPPITWRFGDITKTVTLAPDAPPGQAESSPSQRAGKRSRARSPVDCSGAGAGLEMHAQQQQEQHQQQSGLPPLPPHHLPTGGAAGPGPAWPPYLTVTAASLPPPAVPAQQPSPSASAAVSAVAVAASSGDEDGDEDESLQSGGGSGSGSGSGSGGHGGAKSGSGSGGSGGKGRPAAHNFGRYGDHLPYNGRKICRVKGCTGNQRWPDYLCGQHGGGRCRWEGCSLFHQGINSMGLLLCGKHCKAVGATYRRPSKGGAGGGGDSKKRKIS